MSEFITIGNMVVTIDPTTRLVIGVSDHTRERLKDTVTKTSKPYEFTTQTFDGVQWDGLGELKAETLYRNGVNLARAAIRDLQLEKTLGEDSAVMPHGYRGKKEFIPYWVYINPDNPTKGRRSSR